MGGAGTSGLAKGQIPALSYKQWPERAALRMSRRRAVPMAPDLRAQRVQGDVVRSRDALELIACVLRHECSDGFMRCAREHRVAVAGRNARLRAQRGGKVRL